MSSDYLDFVELSKSVSINHITSDSKHLFSSEDLKNVYEQLYLARNRYAHNLLSYRELPFGFNEMSTDKYKPDNYLIYMFILGLIDLIAIEEYKALIAKIDTTIY